MPFLTGMDNDLVYMSDQHRESLAKLIFLIDQNRAAGMVYGQFGVGKSLTLDLLSNHAEKRGIPMIRTDAVPENSAIVASYIIECMGIQGRVSSTEDGIALLRQYCRTEHNTKHFLLFIDEAHNLAYDSGCYFVHFLTNLRITKGNLSVPLFTIILAGSPELPAIINSYESLRQRIQFSFALEPLSEDQTIEYIQFRLHHSGGDDWIFTRDALLQVYQYTQGKPRSINYLCDTALMLGYAAKVPEITPDIIDSAAEDCNMVG